MNADRTLLRDEQWARIKHLLPGKETDRGQTAADNRLFVEAVLHVLRTGQPWRDLPPHFGNWNSTYRRFARWDNNGIWHRVFGELAKDSDFEALYLDSTIVRAHQHAAGAPKKGDQALGRSRGGLSTKIHAVVEGLGQICHWILTGGQINDCSKGTELLEEAPQDGTVGTVTADKGYDTDAIIQRIFEIGAEPVIPSKANRVAKRPLDAEQYKCRNLVERFFCRIKQFRRIATRYDKLASRFGSFIALAAAYIWLS